MRKRTVNLVNRYGIFMQSTFMVATRYWYQVLSLGKKEYDKRRRGL